MLDVNSSGLWSAPAGSPESRPASDGVDALGRARGARADGRVALAGDHDGRDPVETGVGRSRVEERAGLNERRRSAGHVDLVPARAVAVARVRTDAGRGHGDVVRGPDVAVAQLRVEEPVVEGVELSVRAPGVALVRHGQRQRRSSGPRESGLPRWRRAATLPESANVILRSTSSLVTGSSLLTPTTQDSTGEAAERLSTPCGV